MDIYRHFEKISKFSLSVFTKVDLLLRFVVDAP